jgi:hypothetical protein
MRMKERLDGQEAGANILKRSRKPVDLDDGCKSWKSHMLDAFPGPESDRLPAASLI